MAMQQEPIDWRYLPYIRPIFQAYVSGNITTHNMARNMVLTYLHFRILTFQWNDGRKPWDSMDWFSWENLHREPMGFYHQIDRGFRLKFSHHPIL